MTWFKSNEEKSDEGVHISVLQRRLAGQMSTDDFRAEVEQLCIDGNLYTTLDDDQSVFLTPSAERRHAETDINFTRFSATFLVNERERQNILWACMCNLSFDVMSRLMQSFE